MNSVLLLRLSAMGDVVQSLGAAEALARARPDLAVHFVAQRPLLPLFEGLDWPASVIPHDRRPVLRGLLRTARRLRDLRFDAALDLQGNWKSAGLARLSGAPVRVGPARRSRREPSSHVLLTRKVEVPEPPHPARVALAVVRALAPDAGPLLPRLAASEEEIEAEAGVLRGLGVDPDRPFRVLVLGHPADNRTWPLEHLLLATGGGDRPVVWLFGPDEREVPAPRGVAALRHGEGGLRRLVALGALVGRAGGQVVGPDQGPLHVLAAAGAPTTVLFGPYDPRRTAPPAARALRHPTPPECAPCSRRYCAHPQGPVCMAFALEEGVAVDGAPRGRQ